MNKIKNDNFKIECRLQITNIYILRMNNINIHFKILSLTFYYYIIFGLYFNAKSTSDFTFTYTPTQHTTGTNSFIGLMKCQNSPLVITNKCNYLII